MKQTTATSTRKTNRRRRFHLTTFVSALSLALGGHARAQSVNLIEDFGTASASQVKNGLGFNVDPTHEWEFQLAQQIGSTYIRYDCSWPTVEKQNPDNTSGGFSLPSRCAQGLAFSRTYKQHPSINALYGPPSHLIVSATVTSDAPVGSYTLALSATKGSLSQIRALSSEIQLANAQQLSGRHSYPGTLIAAVNQNRIDLAAATTIPLPAGTAVIVNELLYPPVLLKKGDNFMTNPSIMAYGRYVQFLARSIHQAGVVGQVGLWNEPVWAHDPWDIGRVLFDKPPADLGGNSPAVEIPLYLSASEPIPGVLYDSEYTNKTAAGSIYSAAHLALMPSLANAFKTVAIESYHPYGNAPEDHFWYPSCIDRLASDPHGPNLVFAQCSPVGANAGSNFKSAMLSYKQPSLHGGPHRNITETGLCRQCTQGTTEDQETRFDMRQFIGFQGLGLSPIIFYRLADQNKDNYGWVSYETHQPLPVYTAMQSLMADVSAIAGAPSSPETCPVVKVGQYAGPYPLATVTFNGTCSSGGADGILYFTWQKTYSTVPSTGSSDSWIHVASPAAVPVEVSVPAGMKVIAVKDTVTTKPVGFRVDGTRLLYRVADNPIEVMLRSSSR